MFGLATAFLGNSQPCITPVRSANQESIKSISVANNLFLAHRQSLGALFSTIDQRDYKKTDTPTPTSLTFEDDVDRLLDNGW